LNAVGLERGLENMVAKLTVLHETVTAIKNRLDVLCDEVKTKSVGLQEGDPLFTHAARAVKRNVWVTERLEPMSDCLLVCRHTLHTIRDEAAQIKSVADSGQAQEAQMLWMELHTTTSAEVEWIFGVLLDSEKVKVKAVRMESFVTQVLELHLRPWWASQQDVGEGSRP
jgi:hypothetical protein